MAKRPVFLIPLIFCGAILFVTTACGEARHPTAPSPTATVDACSPPCWNGITPGQTTRAEALDILGLPPDQPVGLSSWPSGVRSRHLSNPMSNQIGYDKNGLVQVISLWTDVGPTFADVVDDFGEPQSTVYGVLNRGEAPWQRG